MNRYQYEQKYVERIRFMDNKGTIWESYDLNMLLFFGIDDMELHFFPMHEYKGRGVDY